MQFAVRLLCCIFSVSFVLFFSSSEIVAIMFGWFLLNIILCIFSWCCCLVLVEHVVTVRTPVRRCLHIHFIIKLLGVAEIISQIFLAVNVFIFRLILMVGIICQFISKIVVFTIALTRICRAHTLRILLRLSPRDMNRHLLES